ncbi:MAG: NAD(+) synthase [Bacilli bacterium]
MPKIKPITELRDTTALSKEINESNEPIFITKNGNLDFVMMNEHTYKSISSQNVNLSSTNSPSIELKSLQSKKENKVYANTIFSKTNKSHNLGFVKVGCATYKVDIGNVKSNSKLIKENVNEALKKDINILVFPELCLTGYTCSDIFYYPHLLDEVIIALLDLEEFSIDKDIFFVVGAPIAYNASIYNCAVVIYKGSILGIVPKTYLPNYGEFYEKRQFEEAFEGNILLSINNKEYLFGTKQIFVNQIFPDLKIAIEICEDVWAPETPSTRACLNGATLVLNLSASNEVVGKCDYRRELVSSTSARLICGYVYASAGEGESTTDLIFSGHNLISENGTILQESNLFDLGIISTEIDIENIINQRRKNTTFRNINNEYQFVYYNQEINKPKLTRDYSSNPFVLPNFENGLERYRLIMKMQALGLKKRMEITNSKIAVIGLSGGLDSTLALLVTSETFKLMNKDPKDIVCITLPCFGTSSRTKTNAINLANELGFTLKEIDITESVKLHLKDIGHDMDNLNTGYENAQARERTQVLMDYANDHNGIMIGTGDLSELCLGWTTYSGDHMSMYGVNASIPKTLVRELVRTYAYDHEVCKNTLLDIIDTPISPELLPTKDDKIAQKTEDTIGPYELNDFFIYNFLRKSFRPEKILFLAEYAYKGIYDRDFIKKWLKNFYRRFYMNQFKRSCLPDGIKVGTVSISPRGDWRMPSDMSSKEILEQINQL